MMNAESPFAELPPSKWIASNRSAFAIWDAFPVTTGHALIVSRRLIVDWWEATPGERSDIMDLVDAVRVEIEQHHSPLGFNVGFNAGAVAGQTVEHLHVHIIPRYAGDVDDPRGGIRNIIPGKGNYIVDRANPLGDLELESSTAVLIDSQVRLLLPELLRHLRTQHLDRIDIVVSFIKVSGLELLAGGLLDALQRGAEARILTTDYLGITEREALSRLHDLLQDHPENLDVRVFQDPAVSFHPKAYIFYSAGGGDEAAFVGSSNVSQSGLDGGIEWNLLIGSARDARDSFLKLWNDRRAVPLTESLIRNYRPTPPGASVVIEVAETPVELPEPRPIQMEALAALAATRAAGFRAGLVTMATGLGKTWLAAFDASRPDVERVLFIAHREEILRQSRDVFRQVSPARTMGLFFGDEKQPDADVVFATVQTLSRHLGLFAPDAFDYVVVDEFHHAAADSYRKVIDHFAPEFLLGLTATPERTDGADLLSLCADNLVFECDLVEGIRRDELVPFHYWGIRDTVDFEPIPWRGGRFDPAALEAAVATQERAEAALREWQSRRGGRTLAFCASTHHADFMTAFFQKSGIRCASVHSGPTSAPRHASIEELRDGRLEVVFSVDIFNEGLDVPNIDTVLMLRPTESPVIFLQQLGRGLRIGADKESLTVIDFIGNHRSFLLKPRTLLGLGSATVPTTLQVLTALDKGEFQLPEGCSVDYDLTVVEMFRALARTNGKDAIEEYCNTYMEEEGIRPTAAQAMRAGHDPAVLRSRYASWFDFLKNINLLGERESEVSATCGDVLRAIQNEPITKCYKLVALRALIHDGTLRDGDEITRNAETARQILLADPRLARDVPLRDFPSLADADPARWATYWRKWPVAHLAGEGSGGRTAHLFRIALDRITPTFRVDDALGDVFDSMAAEIIEYRIARYVFNQDQNPSRSWTCRLITADGLPAIRLDRRQSPDLPDGLIGVIAGGVEYQFTFEAGAIRTARQAGSTRNALPEVLTGWFGPAAGQPGTAHQVRLEHSDVGVILRPLEAESASPDFDWVPLFGNYAVACEPGAKSSWPQFAATELSVRRSTELTPRPESQFVCFAHDAALEDSPSPVRRGDPLLFERLSGSSDDDFIGEPALVQTRTSTGTETQLMVPDSSSGKRFARLVSRLSQTDINPLAMRIGETFKRADVPVLYGFQFNQGNWSSGHVSLPNHTILFVTLQKRQDATPHVDHFESPEVFVWSSQLSTAPEGKKGREILNALETGKAIELWVRRRSQDVAFTYTGRVVPLRHEGSQPMSVTFRLMTPLPGEVQMRLGIGLGSRNGASEGA
jgi:superfamily II DNA or RNA helicase/HKD family nuclease/diadenosine tetraphosphate (Ap4A) HIT family hydrolase